MKQIIAALLLCFLSLTDIVAQAQDIINTEYPGVATQAGAKKKKGYYNTTQASLLFGTIKGNSSSSSTTELQISPSVTMTNGYMFNEHWAMGLGLGIEIFDSNLYPLFADIRYTFSDNKVSPFIALKTGYAFGNFRAKHHDEITLNFPPFNATDVDVRHYGGFLLNPEIGISISLNNDSDLMFTIAYRYQKTKTNVIEIYEDDYYSKTQWENKANLDKLSFGIAIMFK